MNEKTQNNVQKKDTHRERDGEINQKKNKNKKPILKGRLVYLSIETV